MKTLLIINDPPYGTERCYNALRLASALIGVDSANQITIFLIGDAVIAAKAGQNTPNGYYNAERMLKRALAGKGVVLLCGTCMDARGLTDEQVLSGTRRSTMDELAAASMATDKVIVF